MFRIYLFRILVVPAFLLIVFSLLPIWNDPSSLMRPALASVGIGYLIYYVFWVPRTPKF